MNTPAAAASTSTSTSHMMVYSPTSLERAYAYYLVEQHFRSNFYISGRVAVPFLAASGVDRLILRSIWNLVDPQMQGSLSDEHQLCCILKLVALAQMGQAPHDSNMLRLLSLPTPLATFANVAVPSPAWLLTRYGSGIGVGIAPLTQGPTERLSVSDAFGDIVQVEDAPLPSLLVDEEEDFGGFEEAPTMEEQPVPTPPPPAATTMHQDYHNHYSNNHNTTPPIPPPEHDFGGFEQAPTNDDGFAQDRTENPQDFGDFEQAHPVQFMDASSTAPHNDDDDDDFGGFNEAAPPPVDDPLSLALEELGSLQNQPLPPMTGPMIGSGFDQPVPEEDDFGEFNGEFVAPVTNPDFGGFSNPTTDADQVPEDPLSAFDALGPLQDQPLPNLANLPYEEDSFGGFAEPEPVVQEDDFGGFEGPDGPPMEVPPMEDGGQDEPEMADDPFASAFDALGPAQDQPLPSLENLGDEFGDFEEIQAPQEEEEPVDAFSSALDCLGPAEENQPLPAIPGPLEEEEDDDDDFGDFEDAQSPEIPADGPVSSGFDTFGGPPDEPPASLGVMTGHSDPYQVNEGSLMMQTDLIETPMHQPLVLPPPMSDDPFAAFESIVSPEAMNRELAPLSAFGSVDDEDEFGDFETPAGGATPAEGFNAVQPPMVGERVVGEDDDFGDFETPAGSASPTDFEDNIDMAGFQAVFAEQTTTAPEPSNEIGEDDFGDFEGVTPSLVITAPTENTGGFFNWSAPTNATPVTSEEAPTGITAPAEDTGGYWSAPTIITTVASEEASGGVKAPTEDTGGFFDWSAPAALALWASEDGQIAPAKYRSPLEDDFGDFSAFSSPEPQHSQPVVHEEFDAFQEPRTIQPPIDEADGFADFEEAAPPVQTTHEDFAATETAPANIPAQSALMTAQSEQAEEEDEFADFATAVPSAGFANFESAPAPAIEPPVTNSFATFDIFQSAPPPEPPKEDESGGEWGAFNNFPTAEPKSVPLASRKTVSLKELRENVKLLAKSLPEPLRQRSGGKGTMDFVKAFEAGIKGTTRNFSWAKSNDASKLATATRCVDVMKLLALSHAKNVAFWAQAMTVIRDELAMGFFLFEEAKGFPETARGPINQSLFTMLRGLAEYVRVTRFIVATVGDLMCLEPTVEFSRSTVATAWGGLALLDPALDVETSWAKIQRVSRELGLSPVQIEGVVEIRRSNVEGEALCGLTLQRMSDSYQGTTKAQVEWGGKRFMACSANFWANVVSPSVP